jgi:hypothetical protein
VLSVTFVEFHHDSSGYVLLCVIDCNSHKLHLWREPEAIVC